MIDAKGSAYYTSPLPVRELWFMAALNKLPRGGSMKAVVKTTAAESLDTDALVIGVIEGKTLGATSKSLDKALSGHVTKTAKRNDFTGKKGQALTLDTLGVIPAKKIFFIGLGPAKKISEDTIRRAAAVGAGAVNKAKLKSFATDLALATSGDADNKRLAQAAVEGAILALYKFDRLKSKKEKVTLGQITLLAKSTAQATAMSKDAKKGIALAEAVSFARDLINLPGNVATPSHLGAEAKKFSKKLGIKSRVLGPKEIAKEKMGALMAVAQGSVEPAQFIILEWMKGPKNQKPIVIVGKGITFDTGGISIKPSASMEEMKMDMSGGAAALGAMMAVAALKMKVNLVVLVPTTENMPDGAAIKPGDVATGLSGVTMEIINTDAEGRLILSDALAYADRYKPDSIIDIATLTGACMVALGEAASGLFCNDKKLTSQLVEAGEETGEKLWSMPLFPEHEELIKSKVADVKNVGPRGGGASTAAAFLKKHVKKGPWAHIDIAGTAYTAKSRHYNTIGGLGIGVRTIIRFIEKRTGKSA